MLSSLNTYCYSIDVNSLGPVWVKNGTQLETLCGRNQAFGEFTTEEAPAWCSFSQTSSIDQYDRCLSMLSGRDTQFTYTSCEILHSALCESTEKLCHTQASTRYRLDTTKSLLLNASSSTIDIITGKNYSVI